MKSRVCGFISLRPIRKGGKYYWFSYVLHLKIFVSPRGTSRQQKDGDSSIDFHRGYITKVDPVASTQRRRVAQRLSYIVVLERRGRGIPVLCVPRLRNAQVGNVFSI